MISSAKRRESLWKIVLLSSITWQVAVEGTETESSHRCGERMRSNILSGSQEIPAWWKEKSLHIEGDGTLEEQEAQLEASWGPF